MERRAREPERVVIRIEDCVSPESREFSSEVGVGVGRRVRLVVSWPVWKAARRMRRWPARDFGSTCAG